MNLQVSYNKISENPEKDIITTVNIITHAVSQVYKDGFDGNGPLRRMYARLQDKMDNAVEKDINILELESAEYDLTKKAVKEAKFPIIWSKYVTSLEDALESLSQPKSA